MNSNRKTAIIVGALYIIGTVAGMLGEIFGPNLDAINLFVSNLKKV